MRKALVAGAASLIVVAAAVLFAQTALAQEPGGFGADRLLLQGPGSMIGVTVRELRTEEQAAAKVEAGGVVIDSVRDGGPAASAGIRAGDFVVEFDGERVRGVRSFTRLVNETPPGRAVAAAIVRGGNRQTLQVTPVAGGRVSIDLPDVTQFQREFRDRLRPQFNRRPLRNQVPI